MCGGSGGAGFVSHSSDDTRLAAELPSLPLGTAAWMAANANRQHRFALSRQLAAEALTIAPTFPVTARRLAAAAWHIEPTAEAADSMTTLLAQQRGLLIGHTDRVRAVAFSPNGRLLATASDDYTARLWDPRTGQQVGAPLTGHTDIVSAVAFSPDSRLLATANWDRTTRLWDPSTGQQVSAPLTGHTAGMSAVAFSPDNRLLATASSDDGTVRLWDLALLSDPFASICDQFGSPTSYEWEVYAQGEPYRPVCP
jgi:predicted NACHT family NTPase